MYPLCAVIRFSIPISPVLLSLSLYLNNQSNGNNNYHPIGEGARCARGVQTWNRPEQCGTPQPEEFNSKHLLQESDAPRVKALKKIQAIYTKRVTALSATGLQTWRMYFCSPESKVPRKTSESDYDLVELDVDTFRLIDKDVMFRRLIAQRTASGVPVVASAGEYHGYKLPYIELWWGKQKPPAEERGSGSIKRKQPAVRAEPEPAPEQPVAAAAAPASRRRRPARTRGSLGAAEEAAAASQGRQGARHKAAQGEGARRRCEAQACRLG